MEFLRIVHSINFCCCDIDPYHFYYYYHYEILFSMILLRNVMFEDILIFNNYRIRPNVSCLDTN